MKLHHAQKKLERGFFTCASYKEYQEKSAALLAEGVIDQASLDGARIERYVIGPVFNLNFFYSPLAEEENGELLGVDWRFESSLDGHVRLPAPQQILAASSANPGNDGGWTQHGHHSDHYGEGV